MIDNQENYLMEANQIDYSKIASFVEPIIVYLITNKVLDTYKVYRKHKPKNISKVVLPPEIIVNNNEIDIKQIEKKKYGEYIQKFIEVLINNFSQDDLNIFYNNINSLMTKPQKFNLRNLFLNVRVCGTYSINKNEICLDDKYIETTIYHELFHMASSIHINNIIYSGFHQASNLGNNSIGDGLNEGYTELLTQKYFVKDNSLSNSYAYLLYVAKKIEEIVGAEKMESLYLKADLMGLIKELANYTREDEIMEFFANTDFLTTYLEKYKIKLLERHLAISSLNNVNKFLVVCYSKKIIRDYEQNLINRGEVAKKITDFISTFIVEIKIQNNNYTLMQPQEIMDIIRETFKHTDITLTLTK